MIQFPQQVLESRQHQFNIMLQQLSPIIPTLTVRDVIPRSRPFTSHLPPAYPMSNNASTTCLTHLLSKYYKRPSKQDAAQPDKRVTTSAAPTPIAWVAVTTQLPYKHLSLHTRSLAPLKCRPTLIVPKRHPPRVRPRSRTITMSSTGNHARISKRIIVCCDGTWQGLHTHLP